MSGIHLRSGDLTKKKVTLKEIAQNTGVSLATVHRAIYGKSGLNEETRNKILEEVKRCNYQIDEAASALKRSAKYVYIVLPKGHKEDQYYLRRIWDSIKKEEKEMEQSRIYFRYIESEYDLSNIYKKLEEVFDQYLDQMDGLITVADGEKAGIWLSRFARSGKYCVAISSYSVFDDSRICTIKVNHTICGSLAAEYMCVALRRMRGKVLILHGTSNVYSNRVYANSFIQAIQQAGHDLIKIDGFGEEELRDKLTNCLISDKFDGVFVCNARNTYYTCKTLKKLDLGKDMFVIGTDIFEELEEFFEDGILDAVICQYQWNQASKAVRIMSEYLTKGNVESEEVIMNPVLLMRSNYKGMLND